MDTQVVSKQVLVGQLQVLDFVMSMVTIPLAQRLVAHGEDMEVTVLVMTTREQPYIVGYHKENIEWQ